MVNWIKQKQPTSNDVAWIQLSAGQGPKECGWVVAQLTKKIMQTAQKEKLLSEVVEQLPFEKALRGQSLIEADAYRSIVLRLEGVEVGSFVQSWLGTVKWQGESHYRSKHKRINWFVGVELISQPMGDKFESSLKLSDIAVETMRSGGPGGQHVNKTNSAVRITHIPTGIKVRVESDRSQHRNRQLAMERLQQMLIMEEAGKEKTAICDRWLKHYQVERGSPVRIFQGFDFKDE